jgi:hypothetical protein
MRGSSEYLRYPLGRVVQAQYRLVRRESFEQKSQAVPTPGIPDWKEIARDGIRRSEETAARLEKGRL